MKEELIYQMLGVLVMKETYVKAEIEIIEFESEDVISTSGAPELPFVPHDEETEDI